MMPEGQNIHRDAASPWRPLRIPLFRNLLIADFASDVGAFMQAVGAAWLMTSLSSSTLQATFAHIMQEPEISLPWLS